MIGGGLDLRPLVYDCPVVDCKITEPHRASHYFHRSLDLADAGGDRSATAHRCVLAEGFLAERGLSWLHKALARCSGDQETCAVNSLLHSCKEAS